MTREQLIAKLKAAGYDEDTLSEMDDRDLQNEVTKVEGTAPTNAISQGGTTPPSQYLENQKSEFDKNKEKIAAANTYGNKMLHQNEQLQTAREADNLAQKAAADEAKGIDTSKTGTSQEYKNIRDNVINERENEAKAAQTAQETERQKFVNKDKNNVLTNGGSFADYITAKNKDGGSGMRDYLIADALATFARNTGKDIGNVAAAYSGGTMNNDRETSLLEKRNAQKAQAETEQQIGSEYANSRLGQELRARGLDIDTQAGRLAMANNVKAAMYNKDGTLKYPADSPAYRDLATLYGQLTSGGGSRDSILSGFARLLNQGISTIW